MLEVARHAGVTVSTVSHVVNNTRHVQPDTRAAVEAAIVATGYVPNMLARSLARSGARTNTLGLAISAVSNPYFIELVQSILHACSERGVMVFLADTNEDPDQELSVVRSFHHRRVDGILLAAAGTRAPWPTLDYLASVKLPTVLVDRIVRDDFSQTGSDNAEGMRLLVSHLHALGHRRIGLISGQPGIATTEQRVAAFRQLTNAPDDLVEDGTVDVAAARRAGTRLLSRAERPSAVIAANNHSTIGLMQAVHDAGLSVPHDLAIAGFDDFEWAASFHPRLTVVAQPVDRIGQTALSLMETAIADPAAPPRTVTYAPTLVVRDSCGTNLPAALLRTPLRVSPRRPPPANRPTARPRPTG